jgi:hypothetical protein
VHWCISRESFRVEAVVALVGDWDMLMSSCGLLGLLTFQLTAVFLCTHLLEPKTKFYRSVIPLVYYNEIRRTDPMRTVFGIFVHKITYTNRNLHKTKGNEISCSLFLQFSQVYLGIACKPRLEPPGTDLDSVDFHWA